MATRQKPLSRCTSCKKKVKKTYGVMGPYTRRGKVCYDCLSKACVEAARASQFQQVHGECAA